MAKFKSKYPKLGFYVGESLKHFSGGIYETDDKDEIEVLDALIDANRVDEPKVETKQTEAVEKPAPKASTRKASAK